MLTCTYISKWELDTQQSLLFNRSVHGAPVEYPVHKSGRSETNEDSGGVAREHSRWSCALQCVRFFMAEVSIFASVSIVVVR